MVKRNNALSKTYDVLGFSNFLYLFHLMQENFFTVTFLKSINKINFYCSTVFSFSSFSLGNVNWCNLGRILALSLKPINPKTKISTYYWIICLHSANICFDIFIYYDISISFGKYSTPKLSNYVKLLSFTQNVIQWVPIDLYSSKFN